MTRLRFVMRLNPSKSEAGELSRFGDVTFAPMDKISDGLGGLDTTLQKSACELADGSYSYFRDGDILLAKVTPCFENGKKALVQDLPCGIGFATSEVHVIRPNYSLIDPEYLIYLLSSDAFVEAGVRSMTGAGGLQRVSENAVKDFIVPVMDRLAQRSIVTFLDQEVGRIENLIQKKKLQVRLLNERAKRAVAHLVLGGSHHDVITTDVDYLPVIPAHWAFRRAGLLFQQVAEPNHDDAPVLSVSIHHGISDRQLDDGERDRKVSLIEDRSAYKRVRPGYIAYNMMRAWQGAVGVSTVDGAVSPAYVVAKPRGQLHSRYYQYLLRTPSYIEEMRRGSKGIADFRLRLYWEQFRQIRLPVPPIEEQRTIAAEADAITKRAAGLTKLIEMSLDRLHERRQALIADAISGRIDVTQAQKRKNAA